MGVAEILNEQCSKCHCCNKPQRYEGIHQIIELKNNGFFLYWYFAGDDDVRRTKEVINTTSKDVFILHNTKNKHMSSQDLLSQLDNNNIFCPRCRQIYEHVRKLLITMPIIDGRDLTGLCDHCRFKARIQKPCNKCDIVLKKFLSTYNTQKDDPKKYIKMWLSKIERLLIKTQQTVMAKRKLSNSKSEIDFDHLPCKGLCKPVRDFNSEVMFHSKTALSDTNLSNIEKYSSTQALEKQRSENFKEALGSVQFLQDRKFDHKSKGNEKNEKLEQARSEKSGISHKHVSSATKDRRKYINTVDIFGEKGINASKEDMTDHITDKSTLATRKQKSKHAESEKEVRGDTGKSKEKTTAAKKKRNNTLDDDKQLSSNKFEKVRSKKPDKHSTLIDKKLKNNDISHKNKEEEAKDIREKGKEDIVYLEAFKKLKMDHLKNKEEIKKKKQIELDLQKVKQITDKNLKNKINKKILKGAKPDDRTEPLTEQSLRESAKLPKANEKDLNVSQVKLSKPTTDNLLLELVKVKKKEHDLNARGKIFTPPVDPKIMKLHKLHLKRKMSTCLICNDSDLEVAVKNYEHALQRKTEKIIIGERITKHKPTLSKELETKIQDGLPMLFHSQYLDEFPLSPKHIEKIKDEGKDKIKIVPESNKGIIHYALSDRTFIDNGWTMLPTEKVVRKMNVYRMRPAHPEFDWFEHNKNKRLMHYDTGEKLAEFEDNGRGRWYYRNGRIALDYYDAEEINAQQRFVVYSNGEPDERGRSRPITILATFDYLGNGIVFDHAGKIRLKYNQTEGVVLDRSIGPVSHWKWHTLNDPPVLQQVMIDTQMAHKDPGILQMGGPQDMTIRPDNEEMLAIEFDNFIKEKSRKLSQKFKPFQIKMKALKINEHLSLRVLDQATIYLIFRDGSTNIKLNIGMVLDHQEIVDTDIAELGEVSNNLERFPARTDSLAALQHSLAHAQRFERTRTERERRLRPSEPCASADQLTAAASRPLRPPLLTVTTSSTSSTVYGRLCRKPTNNLYYNTRLL